MLTTEEAYQFRKAVETEVLASEIAKLLNNLQGSIPYSLENEERLKALAVAAQHCVNIAAESRRKAKEWIRL